MTDGYRIGILVAVRGNSGAYPGPAEVVHVETTHLIARNLSAPLSDRDSAGELAGIVTAAVHQAAAQAAEQLAEVGRELRYREEITETGAS